jgi:hypothetical protein
MGQVLRKTQTFKKKITTESAIRGLRIDRIIGTQIFLFVWLIYGRPIIYAQLSSTFSLLER